MDRHIKFQKEIIAAVDRNLSRQAQRLLLYVPTGEEKSSAVIQTAANLCISKGYTCAILVRRQALKEHYAEMMKTLDIPEGYLNVGLEEELLQRPAYDVIFVDDCQDLPAGELIERHDQTCIGFSATRIQDPVNPFFDAKVIYTAQMSLTYFHEEFMIGQFLVPLLEQLGFQRVGTGTVLVRNSAVGRPDISATYNGEAYYLEVKAYRSPRNGPNVINGALRQVKRYQTKQDDAGAPVHFGCIFLCEIDEETKERVLADEDIFIWDIKNLLYLCQGNGHLTSMLRQVTPYPIDLLPPVEPLGFNALPRFSHLLPARPSPEAALIDKLSNCKTGKKARADKDFENICADIVQHLFGPDFSRCEIQRTTRSKMFRMDMVCGIKETGALWTFLSHYYKTRFVVFEFKNYREKIEQNLIYITEKYLYAPALRNVAFILSRKGFDNNALAASYGILKEHGKLIVDVQDRDLIEMLKKKEKGEEPSDYLLGLIENYLVAIDK